VNLYNTIVILFVVDQYFSMLIPTLELVMGTSSYGTPEAPNHHDNERPPPRSSAFNAAVLVDAASR
jgi:hypothetical protein